MGRKFKSPDTAAFKLRAYFVDGGACSLASRDWKGKSYQPHIGLLDLERYILKHQDRIITALIYDKRSGADTLIRKWVSGSWETYLSVQFT